MQKRASITGVWKDRWCALQDDELQWYNRSPGLASARPTFAVDVAGATLRLHGPSGLMSWALHNGSVVQLFASSAKTLLAWAAACERGGIRVDRSHVPQDMTGSERVASNHGFETHEMDRRRASPPRPPLPAVATLPGCLTITSVRVAMASSDPQHPLSTPALTRHQPLSSHHAHHPTLLQPSPWIAWQ